MLEYCQQLLKMPEDTYAHKMSIIDPKILAPSSYDCIIHKISDHIIHIEDVLSETLKENIVECLQ